MKCAYHADKTATAECSQCRKPLCEQCAIPEGDGSFICSRCIALKAAQEAGEGIDRRVEEKESKKQEQEVKKKKKSKMWVVCQWVILAACIAIIAIQVPGLMSTFEEKKPIRYGTYSTDARTDQCIKNLWHISRLLQEGKLPGKDILCPASQKPYVVTETEGDTVVRSPKPELYGFKEIRVSKNKPVPELIR
ncbi:MAG: hypothetical protein J7M30_05200 [Deltaproteobacteria bacterium]|nr:hypothetical protein [Deltaproteobacteria bacterium]